MPVFQSRPLPKGLETLTELALDLRWTWSHGADALWQMLDQASWERTENPWTLLQNMSLERLQQLANDAHFTARVIPHHAAAQIPAEATLITWQH